MQSLFPQRNGGAGGGNGYKVYLSLNCGKCELTSQPGGKFLVTPIQLKGKLTLEKDNDGLVHISWSERNSNVKDFDKIIFPDEIRFKKAKTGRENDRVYALSLHGQHFLFWMQDKASDKDEDNCKKLNDYANNPAAAEAALATAAAASRAEATAAATPAMSQDWMTMMGLTGMPGLDSATGSEGIPDLVDANSAVTLGTASSGASGTGGAGPPMDPNNPFASLDLSSLLSQFNAAGNFTPTPTPVPAVGSTPVVTPVPVSAAQQDVHLMDSGILEDPAVLSQLISHMPTDQRTDTNLLTTLRSEAYRGILTSVLLQPSASATGAVSGVNSSAADTGAVASGISNMTIESPRPVATMSREDKVQAMIIALQRYFNPVSTAASTTATQSSSSSSSDAMDQAE